MNLSEAIRAQFVLDEAVRLIIDGRVHPLALPQETEEIPAAIIYQQVGRGDETSLDIGNRVTRWQVVAISEDHPLTHDIALAIENSIRPSGRAFHGLLGGDGGVQCSVTIDDQFDEATRVGESERFVYGVVTEISVYEE